jgi:hypothetical protein
MAAALVAIVMAILLIRGWRPSSTSAKSVTAAPPTIPASPEIEAKYGVRFTSVDVTAAGGMIQLRYQILDSDKSAALHDAASAPFVVDSRGVNYADPGMVGHTHVGKTKVAGTSDYILLANAKGGVQPGAIVTIKIGDLELHNVKVL